MNMDAETLEALNTSIAKWKDRAKGNYAPAIPENCALCTLFYHHGCRDCPVSERTGDDCCSGTPLDGYGDADDQHRMKIAAREVEFLKSLLPDSTSIKEVAK
jgi:hypothetical protein